MCGKHTMYTVYPYYLAMIMINVVLQNDPIASELCIALFVSNLVLSLQSELL